MNVAVSTVRPSSASMRKLDKAQTLISEGKLDAAEKILRALRKSNPRQVDSLIALTDVYMLRKDYERVIASFKQLAESGHKLVARDYFNQSVALLALQRRDAAIDALRNVLALEPEFQNAHFALGKCLLDKEDPDLYREAIMMLDKDISMNQREESYQLVAELLFKKEKWAVGRELLMKGMQQHPNSKMMSYLYGASIVSENYRRKEADLAEMEQVMQIGAAILKRDPQFWRAYMIMGNALNVVGEFELAREKYRKVVEMHPEYSTAHLNLGISYLLAGHFQEGWDQMCWRRKVSDKLYGIDAVVFDSTEAPMWEGERSPGTRLLITGEQGIGDQLVNFQLVKQLVEEGLELTVTCDKKIVDMMQRSIPEAKFYPQHQELPSEVIANIDYKGTMFDLGRNMRTKWSDFDKPRYFFKPKEELVAQFREKYRRFDDQLKVGIAWKSMSATTGASKSTDLMQWGDVLRVPGVQFFSIQYGNIEKDIRDAKNQIGTEIYVDDFDPFDDMEKATAQIAAMDLVITVSNVATHVAGQLNIPSFLLLPLAPLWHWFRDREDSLWYDNFKIFRKGQLQDWNPIMADVGRELLAYQQNWQQSRNENSDQ